MWRRVLAQRLQQARGDVEERDVMVARHHQLRVRQGVQELTRLLELGAACALGEVARDHDQVGFQLMHLGDQRRDDLRIGAAEVQVGEMDDGAHQSSPHSLASMPGCCSGGAAGCSSGGTITVSEAGRTR